MKIKELLENIKGANFDMESALEIKTYLPIKEKQEIAQLIIGECTEVVNGTIKLNSINQYLSYVKYMIKLHTNLEYTDDDYDLLCSTELNGANLLNTILSYFGSDAEECSRILNLMLDDYMQENSIEMFIGKFLNNLSITIDSFVSVMQNEVIQNLIPEDFDVDRLNKFLNKYVE